MQLCVVIGLFVLLAFLVYVFSKKRTREGFTTAFRDGTLCQPLTNNRQNYLMPHAVTFVLEGYNFKDTPIFYRDGKKIAPLTYSWDYREMAYYFDLAAPNGLTGHQWVLETSDYVKPKVTESRSHTVMNVGLMRRRGDFNRWVLSCPGGKPKYSYDASAGCVPNPGRVCGDLCCS